MIFTHAIARIPSENFAEGITTADLGKPDVERMLSQHTAYVDCLRSLGVEVLVLEALPAFPDAHFVEDTAVVLPEVAIIARSGAEARRGEEQAMAGVLARFRPIQSIKSPATLDGGDVLQIGRNLYIGLSERTNQAGFQQFNAIVTPFGYTCIAVPVAEGLHLKSSVSAIDDNTLLITSDFAHRPEFTPYNKIILDDNEKYAANALNINGVLLIPAGFRQVCCHLKQQHTVIELAMSESEKMDGGLSCLSLRLT